MRTKLSVAAVVASVSCIAHAQSSVTLYGIVDAGVLYTNNNKGAAQTSMSQANSSRWGLRGSEDLGGGLNAIFNLENGFTTATGTLAQGGLEFGRKAFVGLSSATWGTVTAGRQYSVSDDFVSQFASGADWIATGLGFGTHASDVDNLNTTNRIQNAIKYVSPTFDGLTFGALYSLGGQAGDFSRYEVIDTAVSYANGPIKLGASYMFTKAPYYATFGDQGNSSTSAAGTNINMNNPIFGGYASAGAQQIAVAGGSYALGPATVAVEYSNTKFSNLGSVVTGGAIAAPTYNGGTAVFNSGEISIKYLITPALQVGGGYIYTHNSGAGGFGSAHYNQGNLGAVYYLSKSTSLYAFGFYQVAAGTDSTGKAAVADLNGATYSSNNHQLAAIVGVVHRF